MTTKKKKKQTAKEDLIESLMNDVQELSGQDTLHGSAANDLFSNGDYSANDEDEDESGSGSAEASKLWQQLKEPSVKNSDSKKNQAPAVELSDESELHEPSEVSASSEVSAPENLAMGEVPPTPTPMPVPSAAGAENNDDKTINLNEVQNRALHQAPPQTPEPQRAETNLDHAKTVAVAGFANRQPLASSNVAPKISFGSVRGPSASGSVYASSDATLAQSESLRLAQGRILELEKEVEKYRYENDELASAGEIIRERAEKLNSRISAIEGEKQEVIESLQNEIMILKGNNHYKEVEHSKMRLKVEELEGRLQSDFKKIRVRERELENRLELVKAEKSALLRAKDENILDLKRKIDHLQSELDNYRVKVLELNKTIDVNQEQFKRTVRALRLALSNLEVKEDTVVPFKKAD